MAADRSAQPGGVVEALAAWANEKDVGMAEWRRRAGIVDAVAELVEALQEIHYFTREHRRCESDRVRWIAERAERAVRQAGAEPQSLALARMEPQS